MVPGARDRLHFTGEKTEAAGTTEPPRPAGRTPPGFKPAGAGHLGPRAEQHHQPEPPTKALRAEGAASVRREPRDRGRAPPPAARGARTPHRPRLNRTPSFPVTAGHAEQAVGAVPANPRPGTLPAPSAPPAPGARELPACSPPAPRRPLTRPQPPCQGRSACPTHAPSAARSAHQSRSFRPASPRPRRGPPANPRPLPGSRRSSAPPCLRPAPSRRDPELSGRPGSVISSRALRSLRLGALDWGLNVGV